MKITYWMAFRTTWFRLEPVNLGAWFLFVAGPLLVLWFKGPENHTMGWWVVPVVVVFFFLIPLLVLFEARGRQND